MVKLKLTKGISYNGLVKATKKKPIVETDEATAGELVKTGYFTVIETVNDTPDKTDDETAHLDRADLEKMTVDNLKKLAKDMGVDTAKCNKKADYIDAIAAAEVTPGDTGDDDTPDFSEDED